MDTNIRTACTRHCGDGCALIATLGADGSVSLRGDPDHPFTRGRMAPGSRYGPRTNSRTRSNSITIPTHKRMVGRQRTRHSPGRRSSAARAVASMLSPLAVKGGLLHIAHHAFAKITLFFAAGAIFVATGQKKIPLMFRLLQRVTWGAPSSFRPSWGDLRPREWIALAPLAVLVFYLGLAPSLAITTIEPSIERTLSALQAKNQALGLQADMAWNWAYAGAVERLAGIEVPERAEYIRVIVAELNRISSHLVWWGAYLLDLGAFTPILYAFDDREVILDILQDVTGSRLTYSYFTFGGVYADVPADFAPRCLAFTQRMRSRLPMPGGTKESNLFVESPNTVSTLEIF